ncbi:hypothetical protein DIGNKC_37 [Bacillus phage DIGNKC]|uniref:hypothetical protein n=1 Tax=Bacillus phage DIGNKC TaxID=1805948 RepID=UPI0007A7691A|nr:hypothetical protein BI007_gp037 [Bacillus phage DIGNKC]YP_009280412.1 hypothetical protein BI039_gp038 [Bacillus phage Belinda]AMW62721.1 hypothetical protein DIGNKC_37 [Bacillus phage DIGNKC]ANM45967.1 hypothetical protein BELINDA_38 [Bacillus phage Belinda]QLF85977.1 hypothetical protein [Bacillus phage Tomato]
MIRQYDRVWVEGIRKYEGLVGLVTENPHKGTAFIQFHKREEVVSIPLRNVRIMERPFLDFFTAISIAEEDDLLVCEYAGYQNIDCTDKYAFVWEDSREAVKLVGEFIGMKWKIAIDK